MLMRGGKIYAAAAAVDVDVVVVGAACVFVDEFSVLEGDVIWHHNSHSPERRVRFVRIPFRIA